MFMSDVSIIVRKMRLIAEAHLDEFGIGFPEQLVIMYLGAHGTSNQASIANELEIDKGSIAKTIGKLEAKGLVRREENPRNRREKSVELTHSAEDLVGTMRSIHRELDDTMFAGLSADEIEATCDALSKIARNLVAATEGIRS